MDFQGFRSNDTKTRIESWQPLVHVCQRWRDLVFGSPRRLNLQLYYDPGRSTRKTLDVWPALPLLIRGDPFKGVAKVDNVISLIEHSDRICHINLFFNTTSQVETLWMAMQVPFPELTLLLLSFGTSSCVPSLPNSFLGGSAPHLRVLSLNSIPFPGVPKLLLSTTRLVNLWLCNIPRSGYISPEVTATCLSTLTNLESFVLQFESPQSFPDQERRRPPPRTRSILPVLGFFWFKGVSEYLEDLVSRIDTPRFRQLSATFFNDINFDTPELIRFVSRSSALKSPNEAHVFFENLTTSVKLRPQAIDLEYFQVKISCREPDWQLSSVAEICTISLPLLSTTENLFIYEVLDSLHSQLDWNDGISNIEWLDPLLPFTAVKNLYISKEFVPRIAPALEDMAGGGTTEVLPTLQNLYLEGFQPSESIEEGIERFISARRLIDRPIAISVWERHS